MIGTHLAHVRGEPDWSLLPREISPVLTLFLRRCLQKDPKQRLADIGDMRHAIDGAFDLPPAPVAVPRQRWRAVLPWAFGGLIIGGLAGWAIFRSLNQAPPLRVERFVITTPPDASPNQGANNPALAVSPDGSIVVYRSTQGQPNSVANGVLYVRDRSQLEPTLLRGTETAVGPFFSPDGEWIAFGVNDNTIKKISIRGGPPQTICTIDGALRGGSWGSDGTIVFATTNSMGLRRVPASGGEPQVLTKVDTAKGEVNHFHYWPEVLPDGNGVVFSDWRGSVESSQIAVVSLPDGRVSTLIPGGTYPKLAKTGHLLFAGPGDLRAVQFDATRRTAVGAPVPVLDGVGTTGSGAANYAIAGDGSLIYVNGTGAGSPGLRTLVWVDRQGSETAINAQPRAYTYARLSPDGTRVALDARDQQNDIWIWDLQRETLQRLTTDPGPNRSPVWTPDSKRVAFTARQPDQPERIFWQAADGSGTPERLSVGSLVQSPNSFAPDGKRLVFNTPLNGPYDLGVLNLEGERREDLLLKTSFSESNGDVSPDGHWLAYQSNESGQDEIYLTPFPDVNTEKKQVSSGGGTRPLWSKDGHELFYHLAPSTIMAVPVTLGSRVTLGKPAVAVKGTYAVPANSGRHYDVSRDGKRFLMLKNVEERAGPAPPPELRIVLHWLDELKRQVPLK